MTPKRVIGRLTGFAAPWSDVWFRSGWRIQHRSPGVYRLLDAAGRRVHRGSQDDCLEKAKAAPPCTATHGIILLHGLANTHTVMWAQEQAFKAAGYAVANLVYPSLLVRLDDVAEDVARVATSMHAAGLHRIDFVGHSLGGVVSVLAAAKAIEQQVPVGRVLVIASSLRGSQTARTLGRIPGFKRVMGPCFRSLYEGTAVHPALELGVIAGQCGRLGSSILFKDRNDGIVRVSETRPDTPHAFLLVQARHTPIVCTPNVVQASVRFIEMGAFDG